MRIVLNCRLWRHVTAVLLGVSVAGGCAIQAVPEGEAASQVALAPAPAKIDATFERALALRWAPVHMQDVKTSGAHGENGKADYLAAMDYDGDWDTTNNWENLLLYPLRATAYYSMVESETHWFLIYGFYHARDWSTLPFGLDEHENDFEGVLLVVEKSPPTMTPAPYGKLRAAITVAHRNFHAYTPADSTWQQNRQPIEAQLQMATIDRIERPVIGQECEGHGVRAWPHLNIRGDALIRHLPGTGPGEIPSSPNDQNVHYQLVSIFEPAGLWSRRHNPETFAHWGLLRGDNGKPNATHMPWVWDDHDDGLPAGVMAIDPIRLTLAYFKNLGNFSRVYLSNRYAQPTARIPSPN